MAILSNGKFYGFLCSAKETGQKLANGVKEYVEDFVSGFTGHGWKIWEYVKGKWKLEIDTIVVRETMLVFEMLISKIRAIIGAQAITQGHGKVKSVRVSDDGTEYLIELEDEDVSIVAHDFVRCQTFTGNTTKLYHVEVSSVDTETRTLHVPLTEFDQDEAGNVLNPPSVGDELVQFGNSQNKARQSAIYMHADETGQPAIDVMFDIDSKNWEGKVKVRVGGDIPGANGLKGFYCENGMIKSVDDKGATIYEFSPNGAVNIGKGNITYNPTTNKVTLGSGVTLTWDNLSDESKENLKGEPGQDANLLPWIEEWNGYATELGKEYIVTPKMFSGVRNADGTLTGIAQGKDCLTDASGNKRTGIFALVDDKIVFEIDPESGKYRFKGKIESDEILINDFTKLSSAVFCGDYMYSQTGINAAGEVSEEYQLFDPSTIGQPDAPFTPNILLDFNKGSGHLGAGKILFDSDGTIELNSVSLNNSIASGASHFTGEALPTYLQVTSQYVISTLSSATGGYTYLNVPTQRYGGKLNLKLNQAIDITVINMSPQVLSLGIYDMRYQSGRGKFKCCYSTIWKEVWPVSTETKEVNTITVPQYYPVELIFIPTNIRGAWYEGTWLIKNSYAYQLYYHPRAADFLQYDLVPIDASPMKTK